jgi:hypothetical protein
MRVLRTARSGSHGSPRPGVEASRREKPVTVGMGDAVAPILVGPVYRVHEYVP